MCVRHTHTYSTHSNHSRSQSSKIFCKCMYIQTNRFYGCGSVWLTFVRGRNSHVTCARACKISLGLGVREQQHGCLTQKNMPREENSGLHAGTRWYFAHLRKSGTLADVSPQGLVVSRALLLTSRLCYSRECVQKRVHSMYYGFQACRNNAHKRMHVGWAQVTKVSSRFHQGPIKICASQNNTAWRLPEKY